MKKFKVKIQFYNDEIISVRGRNIEEALFKEPFYKNKTINWRWLMTKVKELIEQLQKCDPDLYVYAFKDDNIFHLINVDDSINDRIDINIEEESC